MNDPIAEQYFASKDLRYTKDQSLQKIQQYIDNGMEGTLDVSRFQIDELPDNLTKVGGDLIISQDRGRINPHYLGRELKSRVENNISRLNDSLKVIEGSLWASNHLFQELGGSLEFIGKDVYMHGNGLETLVGFPKEINGRFDVTANFLTTLEGGPQIFKGQVYNCEQNFLTNLEGVPDILEGNFNCSNNKTLKRLGNIKGKMKGVQDIFSSDTGLREEQIRRAITVGRLREGFNEENELIMERYYSIFSK